MTRAQRRLLDFLIACEARDISASFDEMREHLGLASKSGVHRIVTALEGRGFIRRLPHRARAIEVIRTGHKTICPHCSGSGHVEDGKCASGEVDSDDVEVATPAQMVPAILENNRNAYGTNAFPVEPSSAVSVVLVPLGKGRHAIIDHEDSWVTQWSWRAIPGGRRGKHYAQGEIPGKDGRNRRITLHRAITDHLGWPITDHINGNGLDCRRCNLRPATSTQNVVNSDRPRNLSGYRGVSYDKSRVGRKQWQANINVLGKTRFLGRFENPIDAARAYDEAAYAEFGQFARLNFPDNYKDAGPHQMAGGEGGAWRAAS
jgi:hypothetical protein